jgi:hypothetical protein
VFGADGMHLYSRPAQPKCITTLLGAGGTDTYSFVSVLDSVQNCVVAIEDKFKINSHNVSDIYSILDI